MRCAARIIVTNGNPDPVVTGKHSDAPDGRLLDVAQIRRHLKDVIDVQVGTPTRTLVVDALGSAKRATAAIMPTSQALTRQINRYRRNQNIPAIPKTVEDVTLPDRFKVTLKNDSNRNFVLHDDGPVEDRMIVFGTLDNIKMLERAESVYADGTFDVVPLIFKQLYSIHGRPKLSNTPWQLFINDFFGLYR